MVPRKQLPWALCNIIRRVPSHSPLVMRPVGVRKKTTKYLEFKFAQSLSVIKELTETPVSPEDVPGIMPIKKIQPKKTKAKRITQAHGSLTVKELLEKVKEANKREEEKQERKKDARKKKEELEEAFQKCKTACQCDGSCTVKGLKQCPVCFNVLKSICSKKECIIDGVKPIMLLPAQGASNAAGSSRPSKRKRTVVSRMLNYGSSDKEEDDDVDETGTEEDELENEESENEDLKEDDLSRKLDAVWESVSPPIPEEEIIGKWYGVVVRTKRRKTLYIAKVVRRFLIDVGGPVEKLEMRCLMPKYGSGNVID